MSTDDPTPAFAEDPPYEGTPHGYGDAFVRMHLRQLDEENPNWREDLAKREEAERQDAAVRLHEVLVEAGARPGTVDLLMPHLLAVFKPHLDKAHGVLHDGIVYSATPIQWGMPPADWWRPEPYESLVLRQPWRHAVQTSDEESPDVAKPVYRDGDGPGRSEQGETT